MKDPEMLENFRHSRNAGKFPALQKCRKISSTPEMQENFRHLCRKISGTPEVQENFRHSRRFPALQKCRKISSTPEVQENFRHSRNAGNFPAFSECRKISGILRVNCYLHCYHYRLCCHKRRWPTIVNVIQHRYETSFLPYQWSTKEAVKRVLH